MSRRSRGARLYLRKRKGRDSVYVIRDGDIEIAIKTADGVTLGARDHSEAKSRLEDYKREKYRPDFSDGDPRRVSVEDVLNLYFEKKAPLTRRPDVAYGAGVHLSKFFGSDKIADVTPDQATAYVAWRTSIRSARHKANPERSDFVIPFVGEQTARRELIVLSAAIGFAHKEHKLTHTVAVKLPAKGCARERFLDRDEVARLLHAAYRGQGPHLARFILLALYTGTRHEAVLRLKWVRAVDSGSVDLKAGLIYRKGASEKESSKRRPPVPISPRLAGHLRRWRKQVEAMKDPVARAKLKTIPSLSHVVSWEGEPVLRLRRSWNTARIAAGLGPEVTPHVLRHTFATWAIQDGHSLTKVAAALGTSTQMVEDTYGHHVPDHLRDVVASVSGRRANRPVYAPDKNKSGRNGMVRKSDN